MKNKVAEQVFLKGNKKDGKPGKGSGSTAMFIFDGRKNG
jgi:hypothetical protein